MAGAAALRALAERVGVLAEYRDYRGVRRRTSDDTRAALLTAIGIEASSEAAARRSLDQWDRRAVRQILPAALVRRVSEPAARQLKLRIPPDLAGAPIEYQLEIQEESGRRRRVEGRLRPGGPGRRASLSFPTLPDPGYHRLELSLGRGAAARRVEAAWILCPDSCLPASDIFGDDRRFGLWTHLYSVRSRRNWGVGDLSDLGELVRWTAELGGSFAGINPLHVLRNRDNQISPYSPLSRLYRNPLYLDVTAVPELPDSSAARVLVESPSYAQDLAALRDGDRVDYQRVMALKEPVLRALHRSFAAQPRSARRQAYDRYLERQGRTLTDYATYRALADHLQSHNWRDWPARYRDPHRPEVERFRAEHPDQVDYHRYLQFELDRQLERAAGAARLALGLYGDLAIGTAPDGSDPWAFPGLFLSGVHIGAPPDDHSATGQDWGLPPVDPRALQADAYRYWILLLRNALAHMGALRIDHVMGLFRQYWIPAGRSGSEGAYMRFPSRDLLGILALESRRAGAVIIGEDLGTVPRGLPSVLARWGILSSRVMYFERDHRGGFRPASSYSSRALVTANTHDHPTVAGYWAGRDLELRQQVGMLDRRSAAAARRERQRARQALVRRLTAEGCLPAGDSAAQAADLSAAVHCYLSKTPAPLLGIWLDDLTGEVEPVNLPGTVPEQHPNWSRRSSMEFERLPGDAGVAKIIQAVSDRAP